MPKSIGASALTELIGVDGFAPSILISGLLMKLSFSGEEQVEEAAALGLLFAVRELRLLLLTSTCTLSVSD